MFRFEELKDDKIGLNIMSIEENRDVCYTFSIRLGKDVKDLNKNSVKISISGKLDGKDINLQNTTIKDVQNLLEMADLIFSSVGSDNAKYKEIPVEIINGSVAVTTSNPIIINAIQPEIRKLRESDNILRSENPEFEKAISKAIEKYGKSSSLALSLSVTGQDGTKEEITIDKNHQIKIADNIILVDSQDYIYGSIYDAGGVKPNIHIETADGEKIKIQAKIEDIRSIDGNFLYKPCGILVEFKENILTGERSEYKFKKIIKYNPKMSDSEKKDFLKRQQEWWGKIDNIEEKLEELS
jgi:hypothetical protein|nr:MAG TPA: hypothetical protein [Caudoviricetes sp.]